jgi:hypothetical protein
MTSSAPLVLPLLEKLNDDDHHHVFHHDERHHRQLQLAENMLDMLRGMGAEENGNQV